jgi:intracellular multiplication protein IcmO
MVPQRSVDARHEQKTQNMVRDTRSIGQKLFDIFKNPLAVAGIMIFFMSTLFLNVVMPNDPMADAFAIPADLYLIIVFFLFFYCFLQKTKLPFRMPMRSKRWDYNDLIPGTRKPKKAGGIYLFGNDRKTMEELWFTNDDMRTHTLIFGSTGSGKTEALVSIAYNALVQSSGFIYVDGKGDNSLFAKVFSMVKTMGREDDLLLVNFMTGAKDIIGPQEKRLSNTMNPFSSGSSSMLTNLIVSMMDSGGSGGGDGDMWKGRAIAFVEALMKALVAMRDAGHVLIDANSIRNYFSLERLEAMVCDKVFIRDGQFPVSMESLPEIVLEPLCNYVFNLPGYVKERRGKQVSQVLEQHGYITMQLTRIFSSLADTYGHILRTNLAEVDLKDVVLNRRIMVVLLPALEKSPDELSNLGKVIIASLKSMMAAGLGDAVEGKYSDLIDRKPTNSPTPYLCILDEYGYYAVKGFAVVPAQARSLGFSVIFAGQDLPAFQKASKEEAASIGANCNIKICMKLEDPTETWDFFMKTAGEAYVAQIESFQMSQGGVSGSYLDTKGARLEKRARVDLQDLKEQREGEAHVFFKSKIVRARMFYAAPAPVKAMRLNQFLKVTLPKDGELYVLVKGIEDFEALCRRGIPSLPEVSEDNELDEAIRVILKQTSGTFVERSVSMLMQKKEESGEDGVVDVDSTEGRLSIFSRLDVEKMLQEASWWKEDVLQSFAPPMLDYRNTKNQLFYLNQLLGGASGEAQVQVEQIMHDLKVLTDCSMPDIIQGLSVEELAAELSTVIDEMMALSEDQIGVSDEE